VVKGYGKVVVTPLGTELTRKAVHIGMGGGAFLLRWLTPVQAAGIAVIAILFNLFLVHRMTGGRLLRPEERQRRFSMGIAVYPMAVLALILIFHNRLELAAACWILLAFGDGMASVIGRVVRGPQLPWNAEKSWSGFLAFILYGGLGAAVVIRWTQAAIADVVAGSGNVADIGQSFVAATMADGSVNETIWLLVACVVCATIVGFVESLDTGIDDNILVTLFGASAFALATLVEPGRLVAGASASSWQFAIGLAVNIPLALVAMAVGGVGRSGAIAGGLIGTLLWGFAGWPAWLLLLTFFVLGTLSTKLGFSRKSALGIAQERGGRRGAGNAIANASVPVVCGFLAFSTGRTDLYLIALAAAFATAAFDTVSSEIGQAYGRRHFLVTSLRRVPPGTEGAVSVEGTLAGLLGAALVAVVGWISGLHGIYASIAVIGGAFVGTTFESYLGATLERVQRIDNELVNFANTAVGALTAVLVMRFLPLS